MALSEERIWAKKTEGGWWLQALEKVSSILIQERGNLTVEEQIHQLLQSLQHDSASVKATALQVMPACVRQWSHPLMSIGYGQSDRQV